VRTSTLIVALGLALGCFGLMAQPREVAKFENPGAAAAEQDMQSWNGVLTGADCKATGNTGDKCEVTDTTKTFGLQTAEGRYLKLDQAGNAKVRAALDGSTNKNGVIKASVTGSINSETLVVDAVQIQSQN